MVPFGELRVWHWLEERRHGAGGWRSSDVGGLPVVLIDQVFARSAVESSASGDQFAYSLERCRAPTGVPIGGLVCGGVRGERFEMGGV
jgi:hypothetical protein